MYLKRRPVRCQEIGKFKFVRKSSIAASVRRVEELRDKKLEDYNVLFLTGTDEHGLKIQREAEKNMP